MLPGVRIKHESGAYESSNKKGAHGDGNDGRVFNESTDECRLR